MPPLLHGGDLALRDSFWGSNRKAAKFLNDSNNLNVCRICTGALGTALGEHRAAWDFSKSVLSVERHGVESLSNLLRGNRRLVTLNLSNNALVEIPGACVRACAASQPGLVN